MSCLNLAVGFWMHHAEYNKPYFVMTELVCHIIMAIVVLFTIDVPDNLTAKDDKYFLSISF